MSNTIRSVNPAYTFPKYDYYGKVLSKKHQARDRRPKNKSHSFSKHYKNSLHNLREKVYKLKEKEELSL
jgi:hypothetical protein